MGRRLSSIFLLLIMLLMVTGCNGARETDEVGYVIAIGLDKSKDGMLDVTYQIAVPRALGSEGAVSKESSLLLTVTAPSLAEARNLLGTTLAREANLSHNKIFIIGNELAKSGIKDVIAPLKRFREFRGSMYIAVVHDATAREYLTAMKPAVEILPSKYIETMMLTHDETSYYPQSFVHEFYNRVKGGSASPYTALIGINPMSGRGKSSGAVGTGEKVKEYKAGGAPMIGKGSPTNFMGTAVFKNGKMVCSLTSEETRTLEILENKLGHSFYVIQDPHMPQKAVHVNVRMGRAPDIKAKLQDGRVYLDVNILLEGEITAIASGINYEKRELRKQLEDHLAQIIWQDVTDLIVKTQSLGIDPAGFGYRVRALYTTYPEWQQVDWFKMYQNAEINTKVTVRIRRTGLMWKMAPYKDSGQ